jgi:hypothetical protein
VTDIPSPRVGLATRRKMAPRRQAAPPALRMRGLRWLTGWITHPSPAIDAALVTAALGCVLLCLIAAAL